VGFARRRVWMPDTTNIYHGMSKNEEMNIIGDGSTSTYILVVPFDFILSAGKVNESPCSYYICKCIMK
jgi:hypothetical protein